MASSYGLAQERALTGDIGSLPPSEMGSEAATSPVDSSGLQGAESDAVASQTLPLVLDVTSKPISFFKKYYQGIIVSLVIAGVMLLITQIYTLFIFSRKNKLINKQLEAIASQSDELEQTRNRLDHAQRVAKIGYWEWNIAERKMFWSQGVYALFDVEEGEFSIGQQTFLDFIHPDDKHLVTENAQRAVDEGIPFDMVHRIQTPEGQIKHVHVIGKVLKSDQGESIKMIGSIQDMTDLIMVEQSLREKSAYLDSILRSTSTVGIIATDTDFTINYFNSTAESIFHFASSRIMRSSIRELHASLGIGRHRIEQALRVAKEEGEYRFSMEQEKNGAIQYIDSRISPIWSSDQDLIGYLLLAEDVTEYKRSAAIIERQANFDPLTELPNRRLLLDRLTQVLAQSKRHGHIGALLFFDLDNFKNINDSLGHPVGDELLKQVAQRMKRALREEDTVSRLGGDEFVILISEIDDDTNEAVNLVQALAEKIRASISEPYSIQSRSLHVTPSIGIALFPMGDETPTDVLRAADTAMYRAKDSGRNTIRFFLPSMQLAADERLKIINDLRQAERHHHLKVFFQPQVHTSGSIIGAEALLRWQHPERGFIPPDEFIPMAEESRQIISIGGWVLEHTLRQFKRFQKEAPCSMMNRIAVNVSPVQFRQSDFAFTVEQTLAEVGVNPNVLTLEVTEGMLIEDLDSTVQKMEALKKIGVRFSIDDFGTGYSSLAYLKRLPLDEIKIDRSFVKDVPEDPSDAKIVETILTMADQLGLEAIAEGVERREELEFLRKKGCQLFQGYYFGAPMNEDQYLEFLKQECAGQSTAKVISVNP
ncbi:MAG: EAL domain-containing protein [Chromatiales bacterium]|nr:EAL domain-containing protein [Chromatiales bacterium]